MGNKSQKQNDYSYGYRGKLDTKVDLKSSQPILDVILRNGGYLYGGIVYTRPFFAGNPLMTSMAPSVRIKSRRRNKILSENVSAWRF